MNQIQRSKSGFAEQADLFTFINLLPERRFPLSFLFYVVVVKKNILNPVRAYRKPSHRLNVPWQNWLIIAKNVKEIP